VTNRSIAEFHLVDCAWFCIGLTRYLKRTFFNQYSRKYAKIIHQLVCHVYSLVHLGMADHRPARQMPQKYWKCFSIIACNHDSRVSDTLPSVCAWLAKAMVHCICTKQMILSFGISHLWFYYRPVLRELSRNFLVDPSWRQVSHLWIHHQPTQHTHMPLSTINKAAYKHYKSS